MIEVSADQTVLRVVDTDFHALCFHALWLRDACACDECRRPSTNERLLDSATIDPDIVITSAARNDDRVAVAFSDGHQTELSIDFLTRHTVAAQTWHDEPMAGRSHPDSLATTYGIAIVRGVEPTEAGLLATADLIGHVLPSNYGQTWQIEATVTPSSNVNSEVGLRVHTDLPYRQTPPGTLPAARRRSSMATRWPSRSASPSPMPGGY